MKKIEKVDFRVVVEPRTSLLFSRKTEEEQDAELQSSCEEILDGIKRHVDDISCPRILFDELITCTHCGYNWEEDKSGRPVCCDEAMKEFDDT